MKKLSENKQNVATKFDSKKCCGCGNCINVCPTGALSYSIDEYGFTIPHIDNNKCVNCSKCLKSCPYLKETTSNNEAFLAYAAVNNDKKAVFTSSSGGVFYSIAKEFLLNNGVVYGAHLDSEYQVKHIRIDKIENISLIQRSKYVQSNLGNIFRQIKTDLLNKNKVLFVGTPCQVAALYSYVGIDEDLFSVDFACHGIPNQKLFDDYIQSLQREIGCLDNYIFRAKKSEKNGMNSFISYSTSKKKYLRNWDEDSYYYFFMNGFSCRDSCLDCNFSNKKRFSDITLCDYWGWDNYHADIFDRNDSVSGVIVNSVKGRKIFEDVCKDFTFCNTSLNNISNNNHSLYQQKVDNNKRIVFLNEWKTHGYSFVENKYFDRGLSQRVKSRIMMMTPISIYNSIHWIKKAIKKRS